MAWRQDVSIRARQRPAGRAQQGGGRRGSHPLGGAVEQRFQHRAGVAEAVLPFAEEMAKALELDVVLVRVISGGVTVEFTPGMQESWAVPSPILKWVEVAASRYLKGMVKVLEKKGLAAQCEILRGAPGPRVVEFAKETPDSLVVMTTHGRSGFRRWVMGSVTDKVVRHAGEPVLVMRPHRSR